jgi:NAD(P)-dependent dehydrogenase (short-subunit alcohol dehydrogenase family)
MSTGFRDVKGKVAIITGAARGIGSGMAQTLASEGIHVVISDILPDVMETWQTIKAAYPDNKGFGIVADVTKEADVINIFDLTVEKLGQVDIVCNNAGIHGGEVLVSDVKEAHVDKVFNVNFKGVLFGCKYAAKQMKTQGFGTIVNTGSFYGKVGHAGSAIYGASKAAIHTLTQALSLEMAPYGVTVNALCPALAATEMHFEFLRREAQAKGITLDEVKQQELPSIPLHRLGTGADSAGAVLWLASESGAYVTGQLININGGLDFT